MFPTLKEELEFYLKNGKYSDLFINEFLTYVKKGIYEPDFIGKEIEVLAEREIENGIYEGYTSNYIKVHFPSDTDISKQFINVKIDGIGEDFVTGNIVK